MMAVCLLLSKKRDKLTMQLHKPLLAYSILFPLLEILLLALLLYVTNGDFVGREKCLAHFSTNATTSINPNVFSPNFNLTSTPFNPRLTIEGCEATCGKGYGFYSDVFPRLLAWLIPIVLMVTAMPLPPIGKRRYFTIIHLFGDPIDSTWSLLCELEIWNHYAAIAESLSKYDENHCLDEREKKAKYITTVLVAMDQLKFISRNTFEPRNLHELCSDKYREITSLFFRTAGKLSDCKTHDIRRTCFAVAVYIVGVIANFVQTMGGSPSPSGGKIAPAMLLSWLLLITLLGNLIGQYNSPYSCIRIIEIFRKELRDVTETKKGGDQHKLQGKIESVSKPRVTTTELINSNKKSCSYTEAESQQALWRRLATGRQDSLKDWTEYLDAPSQGMPTYRPNKQLRSNMHLFTISTIPVLLSFASAFTVLWSPPTYLTCRHFIILTAFVAWLLSPVLTKALLRLRKGDENGWYLVLFKDFCIAGPIIALLIASSCGLFSSCWCFSGAFVLRSKAEVQLNPMDAFNESNGKIYPGIVAANLGLQLAVLVWIVFGLGWKKFWVMRMSEVEKREALIAEISPRNTEDGIRS